MTTDFRALCAELLRGLDENRHPEVRYPGHLRQIMASARAALADEPAVPAPPADWEVPELVAQLTSRNYGPGALDRAAELLQRQALVPVSVSERPWEREGWCNAEGRCWWGRGESDDWSADWTLATPEAVAEFCEFSPQTVCLPAHALPLPEVGK
jgi:hypothetical protein